MEELYQLQAYHTHRLQAQPLIQGLIKNNAFVLSIFMKSTSFLVHLRAQLKSSTQGTQPPTQSIRRHPLLNGLVKRSSMWKERYHLSRIFHKCVSRKKPWMQIYFTFVMFSRSRHIAVAAKAITMQVSANHRSLCEDISCHDCHRVVGKYTVVDNWIRR